MSSPIPPIQRLLLLISSWGYTSRELYDLFSALKAYRPERLCDIIEELRFGITQRLEHELQENESLQSGQSEEEPHQRPRRDFALLAPEIVERVESLLLGEAHLSVSRAATRLQRSLSADKRFGVRALHSRRPAAFRDWLIELVDKAGPSEVLHHATRIRNEFVHRSESDWPLRGPMSDEL